VALLGRLRFGGDHGFDHWLANKTNFGKDPKTFQRNGEPAGQIEGWMSELVVDETTAWLDQREPGETRPFFACLWFSEPHTPVIAAQQFRDLYPDEKIAPHLASLRDSGGPQVKRRGELKNPDLYFGCVTMLDHHIGRLLAYLDAKGLRDNTLVVFTSDNGPEHRTITAYGSSGHLRGAKGHIHDGGIHVPGIVRWPGKIEAGSSSNAPVNGTDWLPTFCAAAKTPLPKARPLDGANVLPALLGTGAVVRERPMLWWLWHARGGCEVAMRDGNYKLLATMVPQAKPGAFEDAKQPEGWTIMEFIKKAELDRFQLYNLKQDPSEKQDLVKTEAERFEALRARMVALHAEIRAEGPTYELRRAAKKRK